MKLRTWWLVRRAFQKEAIRQGRSVGEIRMQIGRTIYLGMHAGDPEVCRVWREIPHVGGELSPEEAVAYWAEKRIRELYTEA